MRHLLLTAFATVAASVASAAVDPTLLGLIAPDATVIGGVQIQQAQASALGQFLLNQIQTNPQLDQMSAATGFDPRRDLSEVVAVLSSKTQAGAPKGIILGHGTFQPQRITAMAALAGATSTSYKGIDMLNGKGAPTGLAFLDASTVVLGDSDSLKAAIDRRSAGT